MRRSTPIQIVLVLFGLGLGLGLAGGIGGCASPVPVGVRTPPPTPVSVAAAQRQPDALMGRQVRWGGSILEVRNRARDTEIVILAYALAGDGEPRPSADPQGRFIAVVQGFVDPAELPAERLLTVAGALVDSRTEDVGEYPYRYPVVAVTSRYLWPEPEPVVYPYPYRGPWWGGWYGYGPWWGPGPWYGPGPWW